METSTEEHGHKAPNIFYDEPVFLASIKLVGAPHIFSSPSFLTALLPLRIILLRAPTQATVT
jgi:hypothetical protein